MVGYVETTVLFCSTSARYVIEAIDSYGSDVFMEYESIQTDDFPCGRTMSWGSFADPYIICVKMFMEELW